MEALLEGPRVSSEHSSASMAPEGLPKGSPWGLEGVPQEPPRGPSRGRWEALGAPGSAKTNSEEGSARAFILMVSLHHIGIHLLERNTSGSQHSDSASWP